jgi:hypothetical protein
MDRDEWCADSGEQKQRDAGAGGCDAMVVRRMVGETGSTVWVMDRDE